MKYFLLVKEDRFCRWQLIGEADSLTEAKDASEVIEKDNRILFPEVKCRIILGEDVYERINP